jgi:hypothetical protein
LPTEWPAASAGSAGGPQPEAGGGGHPRLARRGRDRRSARRRRRGRRSRQRLLGAQQALHGVLDQRELDVATRRLLELIGTIGFLALGFVLGVVAWFMVKAAVGFTAGKVVSVGGAMSELVANDLRHLAAHGCCGRVDRLRSLRPLASPV